jgi:hypothetical protein
VRFVATSFMLVSCFAYSLAVKRRRNIPKNLLNINGIHDVIYQNIELFITTAARTSETYKINSSESVPQNYIYNLVEHRNIEFKCASF